jgi:hypothetical protein
MRGLPSFLRPSAPSPIQIFKQTQTNDAHLPWMFFFMTSKALNQYHASVKCLYNEGKLFYVRFLSISSSGVALSGSLILPRLTERILSELCCLSTLQFIAVEFESKLCEIGAKLL